MLEHKLWKLSGSLHDQEYSLKREEKVEESIADWQQNKFESYDCEYDALSRYPRRTVALRKSAFLQQFGASKGLK